MISPTLDTAAARETDLDDVTALVKRLQWPHRREDIALFMRLGAGHVTRDAEGRLLGAAFWWAFEPAAARLGLVMVSPEAQGRGIGRRMVEQVLDDTADRSMILLATEAGKPLYDKLGFVTVGACRQYQGIYDGTPVSDAGIRTTRPDDLPAILALDATAFRVGRAAVLRELTDIGRTLVLDRSDGITGYGIEWTFGRGSVVGPIVAGSEADAIRLFRTLAQPGFVRVDVPVDAATFAAHLADQGLSPAGADSPVMVRGPWPEAAGGAQIFAMSSHALG